MFNTVDCATFHFEGDIKTINLPWIQQTFTHSSKDLLLKKCLQDANIALGSFTFNHTITSSWPWLRVHPLWKKGLCGDQLRRLCPKLFMATLPWLPLSHANEIYRAFATKKSAVTSWKRTSRHFVAIVTTQQRNMPRLHRKKLPVTSHKGTSHDFTSKNFLRIYGNCLPATSSEEVLAATLFIPTYSRLSCFYRLLLVWIKASVYLLKTF